MTLYLFTLNLFFCIYLFIHLNLSIVFIYFEYQGNDSTQIVLMELIIEIIIRVAIMTGWRLAPEVCLGTMITISY